MALGTSSFSASVVDSLVDGSAAGLSCGSWSMTGAAGEGDLPARLRGGAARLGTWGTGIAGERTGGEVTAQSGESVADVAESFLAASK